MTTPTTPWALLACGYLIPSHDRPVWHAECRNPIPTRDYCNLSSRAPRRFYAR